MIPLCGGKELAKVTVLSLPGLTKGIPARSVVQHVRVKDDPVQTRKSHAGQTGHFLACLIVSTVGGIRRGVGNDSSGHVIVSEQKVNIRGDVVVSIGHHEPLCLHIGITDIHEIWSLAVNKSQGDSDPSYRWMEEPLQEVFLLLSPVSYWCSHHNDPRKGVAGRVYIREKTFRNVLMPVRDNKGDFL